MFKATEGTNNSLFSALTVLNNNFQFPKSIHSITEKKMKQFIGWT